MTKPQKYRDVVAFLISKGWELKRQRGSHEIWGPIDEEQHQTFSLVQHHGEVSPGVIRQLRRIFPDTPESWN